jgi:hypothetical protein
MGRKIDISGTQLFVAMATGLCLAGPIVWMSVGHWLFAQ